MIPGQKGSVLRAALSVDLTGLEAQKNLWITGFDAPLTPECYAYKKAPLLARKKRNDFRLFDDKTQAH